MKRLFLGVFGGFCVVLICIGVINFYHIGTIHTMQHEVAKSDHLAQVLQQHKEQFRSFAQHHTHFDSVATDLQRQLQLNKQFWRKTLKESMANNASLRRNGLAGFHEGIEVSTFSQLLKLEQQLLKKVGRIGFKDQGLIGKMRTLAHQMENDYPQYNEGLLSLRRHEKDFLMRVDPAYSDRFKTEMTLWKKQVHLPDALYNYAIYFDSLSTDYLQLLHPGRTGFYHHWLDHFEALQDCVRKQRSGLLKASLDASSTAENTILFMNGLMVLFAIGCTIYFTRKFSLQVKNLQQTMANYIATNYQFHQETSLRIPRNDFGKITLHFLKLTRKIRSDMQLLEDRVERRTKSLQFKNHQLELQHLEMMESLRYAQDLQQSLLVSRAKLLRSFREAWVYYKPKNMVGGDFYWMKEVQEHGQTALYFALADCTGHGVPGALLSVMGMNALDELIGSGIRQPSLMLDALRSLVSRRLNTQEDKRYDGMDLALFRWNREQNTITFAGAQLPLWILREGELVEIVGQRMPIGYTYFEVNSFEEYEIQLRPKDRLLLFSDGMVDQFGGLKSKKMGRKFLREWLIRHADEPTATIYSKLIQQFESWKGNTEQTDDCTFIILEPGVSEQSFLTAAVSVHSITKVLSNRKEKAVVSIGVSNK